MSAEYQIKIMSYDADGKKIATKNFSNLPSDTENDTQATKLFCNKYAALTDGATATANLIKTAPIALD